MYKLLIADDEALEREGLEMMVRRMLPDTFEFLHAENGRKAIQVAAESRPDFIFMDIKMPGIQGLEAVREIRKRQPDVKIVLVTAHDFFAYAKEAISLGVKEYILKPAKREELLEVLHKLMAEHRAERQFREEELELREKLSHLQPLVENEVTLMLMTECTQEMDPAYLAELIGLRWDRGYAVVLSFTGQEEGSWERFRAVKRELYDSFKEYAKAQFPCLVSPLVGGKMAVMIPAHAPAAFTQRVESLGWGEKAQAFLEERFGIAPVIGIGPLLEGWDGLERSYQAAAAAAADPGAIVRVRHAEDMRQSGSGSSPDREEEHRLADALRRDGREEVQARFGRLLQPLLAMAEQDAVRARNEAAALFLVLCRELEQPVPADCIPRLSAAGSAAALEQAARDLLDALYGAVRQEREKRQSRMIERAKAYVKERYKTSVTMEQTAEHINLSPYYFSRWFKLQTGETFVDYLTRLRIQEAKELLRNRELSFKEICYGAGYNDPNYFSRIFKKTTGLTPTEYRQQLFD